VDGAGDAVGPGLDQPDRGIARQLLPRLGQDVQRWLVIVAEQTMRMAGEAVARHAGIENGGLAAGTAELQGAGETGKAAADDDDVIHGDGLRVSAGLAGRDLSGSCNGGQNRSSRWSRQPLITAMRRQANGRNGW